MYTEKETTQRLKRKVKERETELQQRQTDRLIDLKWK